MNIAALLLMLVASPDDVARLAAKHFGEGEAAFARGDFTAAALAFERAYGVAPRAAALLNAAEAWESAGQRAEAVNDCERALETPGVEPRQADEARRRIARLEPRVARLEAIGPEGWSIEIDGGGGRRSLPALVAVDPGRRAIAVYGAEGQRSEQRVMVFAAGERSKLALVGPAEVTTPPVIKAEPIVEPVVLEPALGPPTAAWIAFGTGSAALVASAILGGLTVDARSSYDAAPTQAAADAFYDRRLGTNIALGAAVTGAAAGVVLWWLYMKP